MVISLVVALGAEVNIGKAAEVGALFTNVHLNNFNCNLILKARIQMELSALTE